MWAIFRSIMLILCLCSCEKEKNKDHIVFGTSSDYPPFEYTDCDKIVGFDIDIANAVCEKISKKAQFQDMKFASILPAVSNKLVDAGISTITATDERKKNFDFSDEYHVDKLAIVYSDDNPIKTKEEMKGKKIACQIGTTMEMWLKEHSRDTEIVSMDDNNNAIEALKAQHIDGVFMDQLQAMFFSERNANIKYAYIADSDVGYAIITRKGSSLTATINQALTELKKDGTIDKLKQKWGL